MEKPTPLQVPFSSESELVIYEALRKYVFDHRGSSMAGFMRDAAADKLRKEGYIPVPDTPPSTGQISALVERLRENKLVASTYDLNDPGEVFDLLARITAAQKRKMNAHLYNGTISTENAKGECLFDELDRLGFRKIQPGS